MSGTDMDPKTSEYAFFKKLKNDASLRFYAHPLKKDASLSSKKPRSSDYSRGWLNLNVKGILYIHVDVGRFY